METQHDVALVLNITIISNIYSVACKMSVDFCLILFSLDTHTSEPSPPMLS